MYSHKIIFPPETVVNFYHYYSYFTLFSSWAIAPLLFYVILTQSGNLNSFKWRILNHSFWCLAFETFFALVKPLLLLPATAGFPIGLLQNTNFQVVEILTLIGFLLAVNSIAALASTLFNRYLLAFPTAITKWERLKGGLWVIGVILAILYSNIGVLFAFIFLTDEATIRKWAIEDDPYLEEFMDKKSFFYIPTKFLDEAIIVALVFLFLAIIGSFFLAFFFIHSVKTHKTVTITKLQRSLIISSAIQILLTSLFLFTPLFLIMFIYYFQIPNSAWFGCILFSIVVTHSFLESLSTLYFVSPYRKYLQNLILNLFQILKKLNKNNNIVAIPTPIISSTSITGYNPNIF